MTVSLLAPSQWDRFHKVAVLAALEKVMRDAAAAGHPFHVGADPIAGYRNILSGVTPAVIADRYLIVYDVGPTCFSDALTLFENLVLLLGNFPGSLSVVPEALDALAKEKGCGFIAAGNSIGRPGLTRVYQKAGYTPVSVQLYKEVH